MILTHTALTTHDSHACGSTCHSEPLVHLEGGTAGVCKSLARWLMCRRHSVGAVGLYHAGFWSGTYTCVDGYTLTGDSDSEVAFVTSGGHEGKMQGMASCSRVRCDAPLPWSTLTARTQRRTTDSTVTELNISYTEDGTYTAGSATECSVMPNCGSPPTHPSATSPAEGCSFWAL